MLYVPAGAFDKVGGVWIVKPACLSRGRGIHLINHVTSTCSFLEMILLSYSFYFSPIKPSLQRQWWCQDILKTHFASMVIIVWCFVLCEDSYIYSMDLFVAFLGLKFDLRLYVLVTSFDPLRIYLFEEGLGRFASVPYKKGLENMNNLSMHLTNYSFNKNHANFVL